MRFQFQMTANLLICLAAALILCAGCGSNAAPPPAADPDAARAALNSALSSWKGGQPPASLAEQSPAIQIADEDWLGGARLADFKPATTDRLVGNNLACPVELSLKDAKGRNVKKTVTYHVTTEPTIVIVRQENP